MHGNPGATGVGLASARCLRSLRLTISSDNGILCSLAHKRTATPPNAGSGDPVRHDTVISLHLVSTFQSLSETPATSSIRRQSRSIPSAERFTLTYPPFRSCRDSRNLVRSLPTWLDN